jgi:uncharacterized membrane protein (DUF485 family)
MSGFGNYVTNVAAAVSGHEGFSKDHPDASGLLATSLTVMFIYFVFLILFSVGAAMLSYNYNASIGTSGGMTVVYVILSFMFSSIYYPYYALVLDPVGKRAVQKGGRR